MTSVFLNLLNDVFNSHAKSYSFEDFSYWLLNSGESKQSSMIYQLLFVARQNERLAAQVERAKERTKQRKSEKETVQSSEATSAFTNMLDNRVEEFLSLVFAMAPLERDTDDTVSVYADWLVYLQNQFLALSQVDEFATKGHHCITVAGSVPGGDEELFLKLLSLEDNERTHMFSDENDSDRISLDQIRSLILFRIQHCLLSRSVSGTFVDHVPFQTDHSAMLSAVATGRFLATHCMKGLRSLHDAENDDGMAQFSYPQLLDMMSKNNSLLDEAVSLPKSGFPIQYAKKVSEAFKKESHALIDEFTKYFDSLPRLEQHSFRKTSVEEKAVVVSAARKRTHRAKKSSNDDDDNDEDFDDKKSDGDEDEDMHPRPKKNATTALITFSGITSPDLVSHNINNAAPSLFASSSASLLGVDDDYFLRKQGGSTLQSPRATRSIFGSKEFHFEEESDTLQAFAKSPGGCLNCKKLHIIIADLKKNVNGTMFDVAAFFSEHPTHVPMLLPDLQSHDLEQQSKVAKDNAEQLHIANQKIAALQKELDESKAQLHESQRLQIATQNAKIVAERECAKMAQKVSHRQIIGPPVNLEKLRREERLSPFF